MNKLIYNSKCCSASEESLSSQSSTYVPGFKINYNTSSSNSTISSCGSGSSFINQVFEKCTKTKKPEKAPSTQKNTNKPPYIQMEWLPSNDQNAPHSSLSPEEIKERCRVSVECRNNMVGIEGHSVFN